MPRALSRDEQAVLTFVRRTGGSIPVPEVAARVGLSVESVQAACDYLISRGLLQASVYAVAAALGPKTSTLPAVPHQPAARP